MTRQPLFDARFTQGLTESRIETLAIVGASARSAAQAALRSDYVPTCVDYFGDADLRALCSVLVATSPHELIPFMDRLDCDAWLFTGALENRPGILGRLTERARYLGSPITAIRRVRKFELVAQSLTERGLVAPQTSPDIADLKTCGRVLCKQRKSAGGVHIRWSSDRKRRVDVNVYFQEFIEGESQSALYVAANGKSQLIGVTRQLIGSPWCGVDGFRYAGSIGPLALSELQRHQWQGVGDCVAESFGLIGLFGVDAISNADGVWPVEVNPRYTASAEIFERANSQLELIRQHVHACVENELPEHKAHISFDADEAIHGKAILYARSDLVIQESTTRALLEMADEHGPLVADVPMPGIIKQGWPILTAFSAADSMIEIETRLQTCAHRLYKMLAN